MSGCINLSQKRIMNQLWSVDESTASFDFKSEVSNYSNFDQLDGDHPWRDFLPEGYIDYSVRVLPEGQVAYFNFNLAKEMGLIAPNHDHLLNEDLKKKLVSTFSLRIINEYDQKNSLRFPKKYLKPKKYMATRYLQLQHQNKKGRTSGDGRSIWNGVVRHQGSLWDVSSRGTGVTALSPGAVLAGRPLKSGSGNFGYGCGMADLDELLAASILAEIFHHQGINTERILTIIDLGNGQGIGVRAGKNLLRPAHIFPYLKQNRRDSLRQAFDYLIIRQHRNREWRFGIHHPQRYRLMLDQLVFSFANFASKLDRNYIFAWLDWDGDNVLASAGIIDYGSVRQFGIRHDLYRYDDVERFSTNLNQQIPKARQILQSFVQALDYLEKGKRRPISHFKNSAPLKKFDRLVHKQLRIEFLKQLGFSTLRAESLYQKNRIRVERTFKVFFFLESRKTTRKQQKLADGINKPAIYNMRKLIKLMASFYLDCSSHLNEADYPVEDLFKIILSEYAGPKDRRLTQSVRDNLNDFQTLYRQLIQLQAARSQHTLEYELRKISRQVEMLNREDRVTGNALIHIVGEIMDAYKKGLSSQELQQVVDECIEHRIRRPGKQGHQRTSGPKLSQKSQKLMKSFHFRLVSN